MTLAHLRAGSLVLLLGCGSGTNEPSASNWVLDGTWRGGFREEPYNMAAVLTLTLQDTLISGTGAISGSGIECNVTIDGAISGERIALDLHCPNYLPIRYRGNRTGRTRIDGRIGGSGIPTTTMALIKQ